jgi:hypothetical protein
MTLRERPLSANLRKTGGSTGCALTLALSIPTIRSSYGGDSFASMFFPLLLLWRERVDYMVRWTHQCPRVQYYGIVESYLASERIVILIGTISQ